MTDAPPPARSGRAALRLHGPGVPEHAQLLCVRGEERLDALYRLELEFVCPAAGLDPDALLYASAAVGLPCGDDRLRWVGGSLGQLQLEAGPPGGVLCRAILEPRLSALQRRRRSRVLRELSVVGLIRTILGELGLSEGEDYQLSEELLATEAQRPHGTRAARPRHRVLVQENESDYAFLCRWLEREGVGMCFASSPSGREQVLFFAGSLAAGEVQLPAGGELGLRTTRSPLPRSVLVLPEGQRDDGVFAAREGCARGGADDMLLDAHWRNERQARLLAEQRLEELLGRSTRYESVARDGSLRPGLVVRAGEHRLRLTRVSYDYQAASGDDFAVQWEAESASAPHRPVRQTPWPSSASTAAALAARAAAAAEGVPASGGSPAPPASPARAVPDAPARAVAERQPAAAAALGKAALAAPAQVAGAGASAVALSEAPTTRRGAALADPAEPALELASSLPGPGYGTTTDGSGSGGSGNDGSGGEEEVNEEADDRFERGLDDPTGAELWADWLADYGDAKSSPNWKSEWVKKSRGAFVTDFKKVMPPTGDFDAFEKASTAFEGGYGNGYNVSIGSSLDLAYGDQGSYSEGIFSGEITSFVTTHSISNVAIVDEISNIGNLMSVTNALITNELSIVGAASSISNVLLSTETTTAMVSNSMSTVGISTEVNHTLLSNTLSEVAMSGEISNVGISNVVTNVALLNEMTTVAVANTMSMGGMATSLSMVGLTSELSLGDTISVGLGSSVELSVAPAAVSVFAGATQVDLALCSKVEAWIGVGANVEIAAKVDCFIGAVIDICLGYKCEIVAGYGEEIGTMKNSTALLDKWSALSQFLGI